MSQEMSDEWKRGNSFSLYTFVSTKTRPGE